MSELLTKIISYVVFVNIKKEVGIQNYKLYISLFFEHLLLIS